jgi:hypothetical protein
VAVTTVYVVAMGSGDTYRIEWVCQHRGATSGKTGEGRIPTEIRALPSGPYHRVG